MTEPVDYDPETLTVGEALGLFDLNERRLLRLLLDIKRVGPSEVNTRWASIAKTHFQQGFMAMNRALYRPHEE
jgi:hypothetical protein